MTIRIEELTVDTIPEYDAFARARAGALFSSSARYRALLRDLVGAEPRYLLARQGSRIVGALPTFLKRSPLGNIINSLPFYGSNGGLLTADDAGDVAAIHRELAGGLAALARSHDVVLSTVVTDPLDRYAGSWEHLLGARFEDGRIGQITTLPADLGADDEHLFELLHPSRRGDVGKAERAGIQVEISFGDDALAALRAMHVDGMQRLGVPPKPDAFFELLPQTLAADRDYRIYVASLDGEPVAALLLFYFGRSVEYFMPANDHRFRASQAGALLLFRAMRDAVREGYRLWNFGGTAPHLNGVYDFKRRWGATDRPYRYLITAYADADALLATPPAEVSRAYPWFYAFPFAAATSSMAVAR